LALPRLQRSLPVRLLLNPNLLRLVLRNVS